MMLLETFPPTRQAALKRVGSVRRSDYARSRNAIEGAVTGLSPYIMQAGTVMPILNSLRRSLNPLTALQVGRNRSGV